MMVYQEQLAELRVECAFLREALERLLLELGVPQPNYPTPIINACQIASDALIGVRTELGGLNHVDNAQNT